MDNYVIESRESNIMELYESLALWFNYYEHDLNKCCQLNAWER